MFKWIGKLLCAIGAHDLSHGWIEDGKGNCGSYIQCRRCGKVFDDFMNEM